jgi:hypothetical protein
MKIEVIPNILTIEHIQKLFSDVDPKKTATPMTYFKDVGEEYGIKKVKCTDHPVISKIIETLDYKNVESVSIVYYPTGSYNAPHADNSIIDNGVVKKIKDWTHTGIIFLNTDFTGGELVYPNQGCVFLPTIGSMVITPAGPEYIHFVSEIKTGERFTLVFRFL